MNKGKILSSFEDYKPSEIKINGNRVSWKRLQIEKRVHMQELGEWCRWRLKDY